MTPSTANLRDQAWSGIKGMSDGKALNIETPQIGGRVSCCWIANREFTLVAKYCRTVEFSEFVALHIVNKLRLHVDAFPLVLPVHHEKACHRYSLCLDTRKFALLPITGAESSLRCTSILLVSSRDLRHLYASPWRTSVALATIWQSAT